MRILFCGTPEPAATVLRDLIELSKTDQYSHLDIVGVLTRPDARKGRGKTLSPSEVAQVGSDAGLPVLKLPTLRATDTAQQLQEFNADVAVVVAYGNIIPENLLTIFSHGWLNLHYSLLPQWRGAAPVQASILSSNPNTGASIFRIDKGMDTGSVCTTLSYTITDQDTTGTMLQKLSHQGAELFASALTDIENSTAEFTQQDDSLATYAPKISTQDAEIVWDMPTHKVSEHIRAYTPDPGAWTLLDAQRYKLGRIAYCSPDSQDIPSLAPGELMLWTKNLLVGTLESPLIVEEIQPPGKKMMPAADWYRGYKGSSHTFEHSTKASEQEGN